MKWQRDMCLVRIRPAQNRDTQLIAVIELRKKDRNPFVCVVCFFSTFAVSIVNESKCNKPNKFTVMYGKCREIC